MNLTTIGDDSSRLAPEIGEGEKHVEASRETWRNKRADRKFGIFYLASLPLEILAMKSTIILKPLDPDAEEEATHSAGSSTGCNNQSYHTSLVQLLLSLHTVFSQH